jgi:hypothetical protein
MRLPASCAASPWSTPASARYSEAVYALPTRELRPSDEATCAA